MNLQKLRSNRGGTKRTIAILLRNRRKKENGTLIEINSILKTLETKVEMLETLNEKILSNIETDGIEDEIVETEIYMMYLRMKLDTLIAERDQRDTSIGSQQPTFHPMDTQRGRGDTGVGGQKTTFHPLAQRDQADTRLDIQQKTVHPDDTPLTLENRNKHALHNPVDTIHLTAVQHERAPCSFQFQREGYDCSRAARHTIDGPLIHTKSTLTGQDRSTGNQTNTTLA
ncbi:hypothetical protein DPMN_058631 [Dreissena polymorpha]|uniref:Uncharacterized protein n=1 Tax=Dreissena polymorpha TaxID=45954 RepID=A0A9D4C2D5_DREPO|nr:hypothetical protein DPMN_058631 [Dreissena polymorpha]